MSATRLRIMHTARILRAVCILAALLAADSGICATDVNKAPSTTTVQGVAATVGVTSAERPLWADLSPAQQLALAPLGAAQWNNLGPIRKEKWLKIANKFASMKPDEQARVQEKMREWVKLSPEQRRIIRENYARSKKIEPSKKSEQWQQYQQLPEEKKKTLASSSTTQKQVANLPTSSSQGAQKIIAPIKAAPKTTTTTQPRSLPPRLPPQTTQTTIVLPAAQPSN